MPPKGSSKYTSEFVTVTQYEALIEKLSVLDTLVSKIENMEKLLITVNAKVLTLEATVAAKDKIIKDLRDKANSLEQYNRKWSIRIKDLPLPHGDNTHTKDVMFTVYEKVLLPIFQGGLDKGPPQRHP
jgi:hypothetical protein